MKITRKDINTISNNLCLPEKSVDKILKNCQTVGDVAALDLGLKNKQLETKVKESLVTLLFKINSRRKGY